MRGHGVTAAWLVLTDPTIPGNRTLAHDSSSTDGAHTLLFNTERYVFRSRHAQSDNHPTALFCLQVKYSQPLISKALLNVRILAKSRLLVVDSRMERTETSSLEKASSPYFPELLCDLTFPNRPFYRSAGTWHKRSVWKSRAFLDPDFIHIIFNILTSAVSPLARRAAFCWALLIPGWTRFPEAG